MIIGKSKIENTVISRFLLYLFVFISICNLVFQLKFELKNFSIHCFQSHLFFVIKQETNNEKLKNFDYDKFNKEKAFLELENCSDMGWFNLKDCSSDYVYGLDIVFLCFQYMIVPTILENNGYNKRIVCYYTSPEQLDKFCNKKKKYKLIKKDLFTHFALLERKD